jgi:hypothetical protein
MNPWLVSEFDGRPVFDLTPGNYLRFTSDWFYKYRYQSTFSVSNTKVIHVCGCHLLKGVIYGA